MCFDVPQSRRVEVEVLVGRCIEVILTGLLALVPGAIMLDSAACIRDPPHVEVVDCHVEIETLRGERGLVACLASLRDVVVTARLEVDVALLKFLRLGVLRSK